MLSDHCGRRVLQKLCLRTYPQRNNVSDLAHKKKKPIPLSNHNKLNLNADLWN